jgi:prepilin-type processing-associated H-X9-DG protein
MFEYAANGVFSDNSKNTAIIGSNADDGRETHAPIKMTLSYVNSNDGTSKTMMLSENSRAWYYAYDGVDSEEFDAGFDADTDISPIIDGKHSWGFVWSNEPSAVERINGDRYYDQSTPPNSMVTFANGGGAGDNSDESTYEPYGYPASNHPGGVNVAYCDGHIVFVSEGVEPRVYAQLMTSNRNKSKFYDQSVTPAANSADRKLPQPSDAEL